MKKALLTTLGLIFSTLTFAQRLDEVHNLSIKFDNLNHEKFLASITDTESELPCGQRRLFKDGAILNSTYDAAYHYLENGSVTMKPGFVAKSGFSIKPNLNCDQTKPALEELVVKHAPQIRHAKNENYHLSSVDWYLNRSRLSESKIIRVPYCSIRICAFLWCHTHTNYQNGIHELRTITSSLNDSNIIQQVTNGNITSITTKQGYSTKPGYKEGAVAYVRVRSLDHLNIPVFEGGIELQYHYFYPWNGDQGEDNIPICLPNEDVDHEADWEAVGVVLNKDYEVLGYTHSVHGDVYFTFASFINKESQGHPILYSANESHAMYRKTGRNHPSVPSADRCDNDGYHFNSWSEGKYEIINIDPKITSTAAFPTNPNWINFSGRWGSYPLGPVGPGPNGNEYFWNHNFASLRALANSFDFEISYLFAIFNSNQSISSSNPNLLSASANPVDMQQVLDSLNRSTYSFDNIPILEGNHMNKYEGVEQYEEPNQTLGTIESELSFLISEDNNQSFSNIQSLSLATELNTSNCEVAIELNDTSYENQLVKWTIAYGDDSYIFEQHKSSISLSYSNQDSVTFEVSAEYLQANDTLHSGTTQVIIPPCEVTPANARTHNGEPEGNLTLEEEVNFGEGIHVLYPNPTSGSLIIELKDSIKEINQISVEIHDGLGRNINDLELFVIDNSKLRIDLSNYKEGTYLIRIFDNQELLLIKRVIKR